MERLTIEDAINRSRKLAERHRWNSENTKLETLDKNANEVYKNTCILYANQEEQYAEWLEELKSYKDIGTPKELKELKENGAFTGLELAKLAIMQKGLKSYKDLEEQGLLVRLPDDLKKKVYRITYEYTECSNFGETKNNCENYNCNRDCDSQKRFYIVENRLEFMLFCNYYHELGKTVFLTREEAEKKLEELKNEI